MAVLEAGPDASTRVMERLTAALGDRLLGVEAPKPGRIWFGVERAATVEAARLVWRDLGARYVISIGADRRAEGLGFEALHCFAFDREGLRVTQRVRLDAREPRIPSITPHVPGAAWAELEMRDLLGIEPDGHPDPRPLVLPDDFPADRKPLRKDFPYDEKAVTDTPRPYPWREPPPGTTVLQLGPFFPVLEEPSQWRLFVDGERVVGADYRGFYCHRAIEKLGDSVLQYNQVISLAERICGICGCVHSTSYCQAVEEAAGIEVPLRARVVRTIALELERLQSHLLWLGLACHIVGFDFVFMQSWRLREPLMSLAEAITGSRKHFGVNLVGGTAFDITASQYPAVIAALDVVEREAKALVDALTGDEALIGRLRGVAILTPDDVRNGGIVGPTARGSGVPLDVRRDHPYAAYEHVKFDVVTQDSCDVWGRTLVRVLEIFESAKIVRQCIRLLGDMPEGQVMADVPDALPAGREGLGSVEAPRGEVFHYLRTGTRNGPDRWRVRAPSYQNIQFTPLMFKDGTTVADVPIAIGSADPCFSCTERMQVVDRGRGTASRPSADQWLAWSRARYRPREAGRKP